MRRAFTVIELLVVVAVIGLLMAIVLPGLSQAREQGRKARCLSNLRQITTVMYMYLDENHDWFPYEKRNWPGVPLSDNALHGFYYGGHPGRPGFWGYERPEFRDSPRGRPFNPYFYPNLSDRVDRPDQAGTPEFEASRQMPVYECPSDGGGRYEVTEGEDDQAPEHTYRQCGSSYTLNWHFVQFWAAYQAGDPVPVSWRLRYLQRANRFLAMQRQRNVSRFIVFYEDPVDNAQYQRIQRLGWHRRWSRHSVAFLDGHAANLFMDTRLNSGPGWKTSSGDTRRHRWWLDPDDPDYDLRYLEPLH